MPAPIVLFVYNRPEHTLKCLESLSRNKEFPESRLFIYADGPKEDESSVSIADIKRVREIVASDKWGSKTTLNFSDRNKGLANSIISGVSEVIETYREAIVLEDDLLLADNFLDFMNTGLRTYENNPKVISIHGYVYPVNGLPDTFFLKGADCWGWATWKRGWDLFNRNGEKLLHKIVKRNQENNFDFYGSYSYTEMLKDQVDGRNNSWAIRWYASAFLENKLTLYPGHSLVTNMGIDGSGTHCSADDYFNRSGHDQFVNIRIEQQEASEDEEAKIKIANWFKKNQKKGIKEKVKRLARKVFSGS